MVNFVQGNKIKLLHNGEEYFPSLVNEINRAEREVYIQTYIYEYDKTGRLIGEVLKSAAARLVRVHLLVDGFGSRYLPKEFVEDLQQSGVEVMFFRPKISPWTFKKNRLRRLHRKICVIDAKIAYVGGINIIDDNNAPHKDPPRIDFAVRIEGPLLLQIHDSVRRLWRHVAWRHLKPVEFAPVLRETQSFTHGINAAFVMRDNVLHRSDIEKAYLIAIGKAKSEIVIANAYFIPGRPFRKAIVDAAQRGVKVTLLLQGRMEYFLMQATQALYTPLLQNGIKIYEYHKSFMHCKVAVIDRNWATVGSSNIDPFSLLLAREANIMVLDSSFSQKLYEEVERLINEGSHPVLLDDWKNAHLLKRVFSWIIFGLMRLFLGLIGFSEREFDKS